MFDIADTDTWLVLLSGLVAGFINTFAGNGSAVTLGALISGIGMDPLMANGTNRLGILGHGATATPLYIKRHGLSHRILRRIWPSMLLGVVGGAWLSVHGSADWFIWVYRVMLVVLLGTLIARPKRWIHETAPKSVPALLHHGVYFVLGVYGGYIQMGMGVIFLALLVLLDGLTIIKANSIKLLTVLVYTIPLVLYLAWSGLVDWRWGAILLAGQITGGWLSARFVSRWRYADRFAYGLLVVIIFATLGHQVWTLAVG